MPITILLVRHGQDEDNEQRIMNGRRDNPLTELGRQQATEAGNKIAGDEITAIYSSPLKRAKETAEIISSHHGLKVETDNRLLERDFGVVTGLPSSVIKLYCKNTIETGKNIYILDGRGVERFQEVFRRAKAFIKDIKVKHENEKIVIVCHNDIAKMIQAVVLHREIDDILKNTQFLENASITELLLTQAE